MGAFYQEPASAGGLRIRAQDARKMSGDGESLVIGLRRENSGRMEGERD